MERRRNMTKKGKSKRNIYGGREDKRVGKEGENEK
jgi:hypothetical protein